MNCEGGFSGVFRDEEGGMWSSNNEGVGAWIKVDFTKVFEVRKFLYKNKKNPAERNKLLELEFSSGKKQLFSIKNSDEILTFKIEPVRTKSVKITIKEVYGTVNNGGAFEFIGVACPNKNKEKVTIPELPEFSGIKLTTQLTPLFRKEANKPIPLHCRESLTNSNKFSSLDAGSKYLIFCPESCLTTDAPVYGGIETHYTKDSAICRSAFHAGKISTVGGVLVLLINGEKENFKGETRNEIKSEGRAYSARTVSFESYKEEDPIVVKSGSLVDVNTSNSVFKKGTIREVKMAELGKPSVSLVIQIEGEGEMNVPYPSEKVKPCGFHFSDRMCRDSLKNYTSKNARLIRFVPRDYQTNGDFLPDYGDVYGTNGKPFGFSKEMTRNIRSRGSSKKPELETHIAFPPSPLSKKCNKPNPQTDCEPVLWAAYSGPGRFKVTLRLGDPLKDILADFAVNGKTVAKSLKVEKNTLMTISEIIEAKSEFIIISSECQENCADALTELNSVEIVPYDEKEKARESQAETDKEKLLDCGHAYTKGRCDKGPDVLHCLFEDNKRESAKFCSGMNALVKVPKTSIAEAKLASTSASKWSMMVRKSAESFAQENVLEISAFTKYYLLK